MSDLGKTKLVSGELQGANSNTTATRTALRRDDDDESSSRKLGSYEKQTRSRSLFRRGMKHHLELTKQTSCKRRKVMPLKSKTKVSVLVWVAGKLFEQIFDFLWKHKRTIWKLIALLASFLSKEK